MKQKVAILIEARAFTGPARNLFYGIDGLADEIDFRIVTFQRDGEAPSEFIRTVSDKAIPLTVIRERRAYDPRAFTRLNRVLRDFQPDVIQVHNTKSRLFSLLAQKARLVSDCPLVFFFHGLTWDDLKQRGYNLLERKLLKKADVCVVVAENQRVLLQNWGIPPDRVRVIENVVPTRAISALRDPDRTVVMCAGRLSEEKGHVFLLEALARVKAQTKEDLRLELYGDGPERNALQAKAAELGLGGAVIFHGHVSDLQPFYDRANLFVLPSLSEGMPNVLLEAASVGLPIIATDVGGVGNLVRQNVDGVLVDPANAEQLARQILRFIEERDVFDRFAASAYDRVRKDYSPQVKQEALRALYRGFG